MSGHAKKLWSIAVIFLLIIFVSVGVGYIIGKKKKDEMPSPPNLVVDQVTSDVVSWTKLVSLTRSCNHQFGNTNQPVDETIINTLKTTHRNVEAYLHEGYRFREVCKEGNKILFFLDFQPGYLAEVAKNIQSPGEQERLSVYIAGKILVGVADSAYSDIALYQTTLEHFRFEGPGDMACNFDGVKKEKILYICVDAHDDGYSKTWYAYDVQRFENTKVKDYYEGWYTSAQNKIETFDKNLLKLFSETKGGDNEEITTWSTYRNTQYGFEMKIPPTWKKAEVKGNRSSAMFTEQQAYIDFYINSKVKTKLPDVGFYVEVARSEPSVPKGMQEREALKLEQGRTALPLIEERYLTMNTIPIYRARREFKKGDLLLDEKTPYDGIKRTQLEYTFLKNNYLYRLWATIDNDNPEVVVQQIDNVARTFQFTR